MPTQTVGSPRSGSTLAGWRYQPTLSTVALPIAEQSGCGGRRDRYRRLPTARAIGAVWLRSPRADPRVARWAPGDLLPRRGSRARGTSPRRSQDRDGRLRCSQIRPRRASAAARSIDANERSTSSLLVAQLETEMRIAATPCQVVPLSQQVPSRWTASMTARVCAS